jgi:hypothetical protein
MAKQKIYIPTYISSINYDPARVLPRLFFYNGTLETDTYYIQNSNGVAEAQNVFPYFDNYSGNLPTSSSLSLLFNNETAPYGVAPSASLYSQYWSTYVDLLYNPVTRVINCKAIIPLAAYYKIGLNDIVEWRGNYYHLRAINDYNLSNGECNVQLLGPIIGDVLANILPGEQCNFDFSIEDYIPSCTSSVSWSLSTAPSSSTSTIQIDVNGSTLVHSTGSAIGNFILSTTSSLDIYGGTETGAHTGSYYSMSVVENGTSIYQYFGDLYGELHFTSSCGANYNIFVSSSYVEQPNVYQLINCNTSASTNVTFTYQPTTGSVITTSTAGLSGSCWLVNNIVTGSIDYSGILISNTYNDCTTCLNPPACGCLFWNVTVSENDLANATGNTNGYRDGKLWVRYINCENTPADWVTTGPDGVVNDAFCNPTGSSTPYVYYWKNDVQISAPTAQSTLQQTSNCCSYTCTQYENQGVFGWTGDYYDCVTQQWIYAGYIAPFSTICAGTGTPLTLYGTDLVPVHSCTP